MIDVFIPIRNKDAKRVQRCINSIISNSLNLVDNIYVIDYDSKKQIKLKNCQVIRIENQPIWNKAHALNLGIFKSNSEYIMTVDADMILNEEHFSKIKELNKDYFYIDTNVRRIDLKDISNDYGEMIKKSKSWHTNDRNQLFNQANGGFQVYSRQFYNKINGIMESLGFYSGATDNFMFYMARLNGLSIVDISYPLLHQEHKKQKEDNFNLSIEEKDIAIGYRVYKARYLDFIVKTNILKNPEKIAQEQPSDSLFKAFKQEYANRNQLIQKAIDEGKKQIEICSQTFTIEKEKPSLLITIINNSGIMPDYFVWDLFNLYNHTKQFYPNVDIQQVNACDVNSMRNLAAKYAMGDNEDKKVYDYVVQLDDDHHYPPEFLVKFLAIAEQEKLEVITGLTSGKRKPFRSTQYYKLQTEINSKDNCVTAKKPKQEIIKIEASGPVGMLIKTSVFNKLEFPYYYVDYPTINGNHGLIGGDIVFSRKLLNAKIPIHLDLSVTFPHARTFFLSRDKILP